MGLRGLRFCILKFILYIWYEEMHARVCMSCNEKSNLSVFCISSTFADNINVSCQQITFEAARIWDVL